MNLKQRPKEIILRYIVNVIGLFITGAGVAITRNSSLGVSQVSSVPNVFSHKFPALSMGNWLIAWGVLLIILQIIVLRKKFNPVQFLQIPQSILFGYFVDFWLWIFRYIKPEDYPLRMIMLLIGILIVAFGITIYVIANSVMNSGEAFVKAIADTTGKDFGIIKVAFDICCVVASVILSLLFFGGKLIGVREGTIISAVITGFIIKFMSKGLRGPITKLVSR